MSELFLNTKNVCLLSYGIWKNIENRDGRGLRDKIWENLPSYPVNNMWLSDCFGFYHVKIVLEHT